MCGICGYISKKNITEDNLKQMTDTMVHRGPDDYGTVLLPGFDDWIIGLGQRRLSILDLSENGHQPMKDESGRFYVVFNGEIYNFKELKKELNTVNFNSDSDTEVLLYLYIKYGEKCVDKLNGMFAFAIYDTLENTLFMARDRMGEKPLYYYETDEEFVFASELKAIMKYPGYTKEIRQDVLRQYFCQNVILSPNTIFKNTYKLRAGECLIWKSGKVTNRMYFDIYDKYVEGTSQIIDDYDKCKSILKDLLYDSVEKRLISDVPFGSFLSGGIDSTLISAIAGEVTPGGIDTFSIGFEDERFNEAPFAREAAGKLNVRHHEMIMKEKELADTLNEMSHYYDEPFSDASQLSTMLVARFAKEKVTVTLSGDGGDELFAGYTQNDTLNVLQKNKALIGMVRNITPRSVAQKVKSDKYRIMLTKSDEYACYQYYSRIREELTKSILVTDSGSGIVHDDRLQQIEDWKQRRSILDMLTYLPDEIMTKTDRAAMRYSLEMRSPILDYRIVEHSFRIPMKYKYHGGEKKFILKDILYDYVPKEIMDRPKKGFSVPIHRWLTTTLKDTLYRYADADILNKQGIFRPEGIKMLIERMNKEDQSSVTQTVWAFYSFQMWYREWIEDLWN